MSLWERWCSPLVLDKCPKTRLWSEDGEDINPEEAAEA